MKRKEAVEKRLFSLHRNKDETMCVESDGEVDEMMDEDDAVPLDLTAPTIKQVHSNLLE